jgi:AcrR family transcriptional regulator
MDKSDGQSDRTTRRSAASAATRERLLVAAAELIAQLGWGRVTTRAVAARAGLPHGAVSYHFSGKQELLGEAAMHAFERAVPIEEFTAPRDADSLIDTIAAELGGAVATDSTLSRLMLEAMLEAERDQGLRERMGALLATYRTAMVEVVRDGQERGAVSSDAPAAAIATLLGAVGDGLMLQMLLDPELDARAPLEALRTLMRAS